MHDPAAALNAAEVDADEAFGMRQVGTVSESCSAAPIIVDPTKKHWIEIVLIDESSNPVVDEEFVIITPTGDVIEGKLNTKGRARIQGLGAGNCSVTFPRRDGSAWAARK